MEKLMEYRVVDSNFNTIDTGRCLALDKINIDRYCANIAYSFPVKIECKAVEDDNWDTYFVISKDYAQKKQLSFFTNCKLKQKKS